MVQVQQHSNLLETDLEAAMLFNFSGQIFVKLLLENVCQKKKSARRFLPEKIS